MAWIHDSLCAGPYVPTPQNPSYSGNPNYSGNPHGYIGSSGSANQSLSNGANGTFSNSLNQNAGYTTVNTKVDAGAITATISPSKPIAVMGWTADMDIYLTINTRENGQDIKLEFTPERDISTRELMQVMKLTLLITNNGVMFNADPMAFIRKHNLERHFKFIV
jgi:hypothetical protein